MSLLPQETIDVYRDTIDRVVDVYGFEVELYVPLPNVVEQRETLDIYQERPNDNTEHFKNPIKTRVFVEWKPDMKRLRRFGIFTEDALPIVAWFKSIPELTRNAYIKVALNYSKGEWGTDEFELVDCLIKNSYNAVVVQCWSIAPRRR